ncbi:MAG: AAA family ATPase [Candidatus Poribacteria bacterium]|nr:AAA family ATPase [Candidatus Poribacteria bacterium]
MYLNRIYLENTGPISKCHVKLPFDEDKPFPVVIVGPNGSGKTIFLSYIVDALTEFAKKTFRDTVPLDGLSSPYFRIVGSTTVRSGQSYSLSLLHFNTNDSDLHFCEKMGTPDMSVYSDELKSVFSPIWNMPTKEDPKQTTGNQETIRIEMRNGAHAFFPSSRHEDPDWLNPKSLKVGFDTSAHRRFADQLKKPIWVETCAEENIGWILDVLLDSSIDVELLWKLQVTEGGERILPNARIGQIEDIKDRNLLRNAIRNVDSVLKIILQDSSAMFRHTFRNHSLSRLVIDLKAGQTILSPNSLSAGQSQLFHLFTTIIRYGKSADINNSINLPDITGIVVIDEIDTNLHSTLQHDVLPRLIRMFPKVQFIISSHSPLFLLGMEKIFGSDGFVIIELPDGNPISCERFSEFEKAYEYYKSTKRFEEETEQREEELKQRFANLTKPIVLTEGKTDTKYIQTALKLLGEEDLLNFLDIRPIGKEGNEGDTGGKSGLDKFHEVYVVKSSIIHQPILLLYDFDVKKIPNSVEKLLIRRISENPENTKVTEGIENLFPKELFEKRFYHETVIKQGDGGQIIKEELNKTEFCDWVCENGSADDFAKFDSVIQILKEFVKTSQQPTNEQSTPE